MTEVSAAAYGPGSSQNPDCLGQLRLAASLDLVRKGRLTDTKFSRPQRQTPSRESRRQRARRPRHGSTHRSGPPSLAVGHVRILGVVVAIVVTAHLAVAWLAGESGSWQVSHRAGFAVGALSLPAWAATTATAGLGALVVWQLLGRLEHDRIQSVSGALVLAGVLATLIDRAPDLMVTDYFFTGLTPPFNIADVAVLLGLMAWCCHAAVAAWNRHRSAPPTHARHTTEKRSSGHRLPSTGRRRETAPGGHRSTASARARSR